MLFRSQFAKPFPIPKGTTIECVAHFDNSAANPANPDPTKTVRWGDQTWEEMMIGWYSHVDAVKDGAGDDASQPAAAVTAAWRKAGAEIGWMDASIEFGNHMFYGAVQRTKGDLVAFRLADSQSATLKGLPQPDFPFGLSLRGPKVTDADLKELAPLKQLQALHLAETKITDVGLKELAGMKPLQSLSLSGAAITDAGLKEQIGRAHV